MKTKRFKNLFKFIILRIIEFIPFMIVFTGHTGLGKSTTLEIISFTFCDNVDMFLIDIAF